MQICIFIITVDIHKNKQNKLYIYFSDRRKFRRFHIQSQNAAALDGVL
jgi:hypothetical protein